MAADEEHRDDIFQAGVTQAIREKFIKDMSKFIQWLKQQEEEEDEDEEEEDDEEEEEEEEESDEKE